MMKIRQYNHLLKVKNYINIDTDQKKGFGLSSFFRNPPIVDPLEKDGFLDAIFVGSYIFICVSNFFWV